MVYRFKNGIAEELDNAEPLIDKNCEDVFLTMNKAGYTKYFESGGIDALSPLFNIAVYTSTTVASRWVVLVWDEFEFLDEYRAESSFDLATLVNTFCTPLGSGPIES